MINQLVQLGHRWVKRDQSECSFNAEYWTRFTILVTGWWEDQRSREKGQCSWGAGATAVQWELGAVATYQEI